MHQSTPAKTNLTNLKLTIRSQRNYIKNNKDNHNHNHVNRNMQRDRDKLQLQQSLLLQNMGLFIKRTDSEIEHQQNYQHQPGQLQKQYKPNKNQYKNRNTQKQMQYFKLKKNNTQNQSSSLIHHHNNNNRSINQAIVLNNSKIKTQPNDNKNNSNQIYHYKSIKSQRRVISSNNHQHYHQHQQQNKNQLRPNKKLSAQSLAIFIPKSQRNQNDHNKNNHNHILDYSHNHNHNNRNLVNRYKQIKDERHQHHGLQSMTKIRAKSENTHKNSNHHNNSRGNNSNSNSNRISHNSNSIINSNSNRVSHSSDNKYKNKNNNDKSDRQKRIQTYTLHRIPPTILLSKQHSQSSKYKNQKLDILTQQLPKIKSRIPQYKLEQSKLIQDMQLLMQQFQPSKLKKQQQNRQIVRDSQNYRTLMGKLLYFIGYQIQVRFGQDLEQQFQNNQMVVSSYYQIYFALRLKAHLLVLECYLVLIDYSISKFNYIHAQKYAEKCLLASIFYRQKYYQQKSIQKISMCEYYKGNICEATYLHDNNGQVAGDSIKKIREGYNEQQQINTIFHHLYETSRFDVRQLLNQTDAMNYMKNYKAMVIFKSPRIGLDDSMNAKKQQLKLDIRTMERVREFKIQAEIMKKEIKRHQNLFTVRKTSAHIDQFRLVRKNLRIDQENQSSQILRAHQSLNRVKQIKKKPIKDKLNLEFNQFCKKILTKLKQQSQAKLENKT